jgi:hypothetical protein
MAWVQDSIGQWYDNGLPGFEAPYGSLEDQAAAIATGLGETSPGAQTVYDFAPIFDSAANRATQMNSSRIGHEEAAINRYLAEHNQNPRPFTWTAEPDRVLAAIARGKQTLESLH